MPSDPEESTPLRVLLLGASGRLGRAIHDALQRGSAHSTVPSPAAAGTRPARRLQVMEPAHGERWIDLAPDTSLRAPPGTLPDPGQPSLRLLQQCRRWLQSSPVGAPDVIINCIAMSDVDRCEREPGIAMQINAALPAALARAASEQRARLIHFSTDFVFAGESRRSLRESDPTAPLSVYGRSKLAGEHAIAAQCARWWIFRISWLYGSASRNLAATLLDPAQAGREIRLVCDRTGVPNPVQLVAREVAAAIGSDTGAHADGIYHLSCHGRASWYEFGCEFVTRALAGGRIAAGRAPRIVAVRESASPARPARRPACSVLDASRYERVFGRRLPEWQQAIALAL